MPPERRPGAQRRACNSDSGSCQNPHSRGFLSTRRSVLPGRWAPAPGGTGGLRSWRLLAARHGALLRRPSPGRPNPRGGARRGGSPSGRHLTYLDLGLVSMPARLLARPSWRGLQAAAGGGARRKHADDPAGVIAPRQCRRELRPRRSARRRKRTGARPGKGPAAGTCGPGALADLGPPGLLAADGRRLLRRSAGSGHRDAAGDPG